MSASASPSFAQLFTPKLVTVLREGYGVRDWRADIIAGLTVAIVALPLSMAIAIASGVTPARGLYTAIIGGVLVSALGGSRFQVGGPAGAFITLVAATVQAQGVDGLILATFLAGAILIAIGLLRLGTFIKYIPYPVTVGFTAGIAAIIAASQLHDLLGLRLTHEPGAFVPKLLALAHALPTANPAAIAVSVACIAGMAAIRHWRPLWPAYLIVTAAAALACAAGHLPVETIGSRFGGIPQGLPMPRIPLLTEARLATALPYALSFALLGSIESLLSAVVADSMSGARHRSNCELVAQGIANMACAVMGGICVTGAIARTATNIRAGSRGPVSGILAALFLLAFLLLAAPLAAAIPLAALAAILVVVAWGMAERHAFATLLRASRGDAAVLLATFGLVLWRDLTTGILAGFCLGALLFLHRAAQATRVQTGWPMPEEDEADTPGFDAALAAGPEIAVYRISGAFFFGTAGSVALALDSTPDTPRAYILDFSAVPLLDSTAAATLATFARRAEKRASAVILTGTSHDLRRTLIAQGVRPPLVRFRTTIRSAVAALQEEAAGQPMLALPAGVAAPPGLR